MALVRNSNQFPWDTLQRELELIIEMLQPLTFVITHKRERRKVSTQKNGNLILVGPNTNPAELREWQQTGLGHAAYLMHKIAQKQLDYELLLAWGDLQYCCGMVGSPWSTQRYDDGRNRAGEAGGRAVSKEDKRIWVARELHRRTNSGQMRHLAEADLAKAIATALKKSELPEGMEKAWLRDLLNESNLLRDAYTAKRFSKTRVSELAKKSSKYPSL